MAASAASAGAVDGRVLAAKRRIGKLSPVRPGLLSAPTAAPLPAALLGLAAAAAADSGRPPRASDVLRGDKVPPRPAVLLPSALPAAVPAVLASLEVKGRLGLPDTGMVRGTVVRLASVLVKMPVATAGACRAYSQRCE